MTKAIRESRPTAPDTVDRTVKARRSAAVVPLFDSIPFPCLLVGNEGRISAANRNFEDRFGKEEAELLGSSVTLVAGPYGEKAEGGALLSAVTEGCGLIELTGFDAGGMAFPCVVTVSPLREPVGAATRLVTTIR